MNEVMVTHSLKYFYTGSSQVPNFPEFVSVGMVDDVQMFHCDSKTKRSEPKQDWMNKVTADDPQYWEGETERCLGSQQAFKVSIESAKKRFNQTGGVHIFQKMYGCEWDDETGEVNGFQQFGYDGEDFIVFDLKTVTWIAPKQQALPTKHKWDRDKANNDYWKNYFSQICPDWLKKYVDYGKRSLLRTDLPSVSLLQKTPSSPVSCHATGFYPNRAMMFWRKDGEELHDGVEPGEILPNHDGSFQMSVDLDLSSVKPEDWRKYECVFHLSGVKDDIVTKLDKRVIQTNWDKTVIRTNEKVDISIPIIAAVVVLALVLIAVVGFVVYKKNAKHLLKFYLTASSGVSNFPEFVAVAVLNEIEIAYYDSNIKRTELKQDWMSKLIRDDPQRWERNRFNCKDYHQIFKEETDTFKQRLNQTGDVHVAQEMAGCEWDDETGEINGYQQYGYNGEDFISLDLKTMTWITQNPQAVIIKHKWDRDESRNEFWKNFVTRHCPEKLKKYLNLWKSSEQRTGRFT
ncbi:hypothetical protein PAMP_008444 [Pampus punctatissimus]